MVVGNDRYMVVEDMCFDDVVEEMPAYPTEVAIDGTGGTASEGPSLGVVVWEAAVGVVEIGE